MTDRVEAFESYMNVQENIITNIASKWPRRLKEEQNVLKGQEAVGLTEGGMESVLEKLASQAFLKIRQNADIFINLLVLMLVAGLDELDQPSISFVKSALFLNVSEEEATVQFKHTID